MGDAEDGSEDGKAIAAPGLLAPFSRRRLVGAGLAGSAQALMASLSKTNDAVVPAKA